MAYASRAGRALTNASAPQAHAICDRCGARVNHVQLRWQYDYTGTELVNQRLLVCSRCLDIPQPQLMARRIGPDPLPILNPRPENFSAAENTALSTNAGSAITDNSGNVLTID